tara:strand:- start:543 stop:1463 length:921 start_codon:yes stop_codon:yes gene_type:complete
MTSRNGDVDFFQVARILWKDRVAISVVSLSITVLVIVVLQFVPDSYRAEALLAPKVQGSSSGLAALAGRYSDLASLAGISVGGESSDKTKLAIEILRSRRFITDFIESRNALIPLLAADSWNAETGQLAIDQSKYDSDRRQWVRDVRPPKSPVPSPNEAYEAFSELLRVWRDAETGFVRVSIEHLSPVVAKRWVDELVSELNRVVLERDVQQAENAIDYLQSQIEGTSLADLRAVFFRLIEEQTQTLVLAKVSPEYVFQTIDPAVVAEEKSGPARIKYALFTLVLSLFSMMSLSLFRSFLERRDSE